MDKIIASGTLDVETGRITFDAPPPDVSYLVGLDLGQSHDYTALCVIERYGRNADEAFYHCRHLQRYKLGTSYPAIVSDVRALCRREPLLSNRPTLAVDQTGVGRPVVDLFRQAALNAKLRAVLIHGGDHAVTEGSVSRVPKRELVSVTQVLLQTRRLKIASELPDIEVLTQELQNFQVKISEAGFDTYEGRVGAHDDMVLSVAMALWVGQKTRELKVYF